MAFNKGGTMTWHISSQLPILGQLGTSQPTWLTLSLLGFTCILGLAVLSYALLHVAKTVFHFNHGQLIVLSNRLRLTLSLLSLMAALLPFLFSISTTLAITLIGLVAVIGGWANYHANVLETQTEK